jgi:O-methyltransferase domain/Dimerisation domain
VVSLDDDAVAKLTGQLAGGLVAQMITTAAELGLADALAPAPADPATLARVCRAEVDSLRRLLRGLCSIGLVEEVDTDLFDLTETGQLLRSDHPRSLYSWARVQGRLFARLWGALPEVVRTGRAASELVFGAPFYEYLAAEPELWAEYDRSMDETSRVWFEDVLDALDWSGVHRVVDVGGGRGASLALVLLARPDLVGMVYDLPAVAAGASAALASAGLAGRGAVMGGDFFKWVPPGADAYLLVRVVFNWPDEPATSVLRRCREAMARGSRLVIIDQVVPDHEVSDPVKFNDVNLMAAGGRARRLSEWDHLLAGSGLARTHTELPWPTGWSAIIARPA